MNKFIPRTLFGYIFQRAAISFFLFLMIISTILLLVSFIQYADIFLIANISSGDILKIILLMFPLSFEFAIPLSVVASLMYVFYVMEVKNEVLAIELTGFNRYIFAYPVLLFATLIFLVNLIFSLLLFPLSISRIKAQAMNYTGSNIKNALIDGRINDDIPDTVIYFKSRDENDRYKNLYVFQRGESGEHLLIYSKEARFDFAKEDLSIGINMNNGKIIAPDGNSIRNIIFEEGRLSIDVADIIEKKVKNIRGFYGNNTPKEKSIVLYDGIYLSLVNLWICLIGVIIFIGRLDINHFIRYILFFLFTGLYYIGFRGYHSAFESGFMRVSEAFFSILFLMSLFLILIKRMFVLR